MSYSARMEKPHPLMLLGCFPTHVVFDCFRPNSCILACHCILTRNCCFCILYIFSWLLVGVRGLLFHFAKILSCSDCFISGSCKCCRVVKTLSSNVVALALHCLLSHWLCIVFCRISIFFIHLFYVLGSTSSLRASVWALPADFRQLLKHGYFE